MPDPYPLESLLSVRTYREDAAKRNLVRAQQAIREAEAEKVKREEELEAWRVWRVEETDRRYAAFLGKPTQIEQIDAFNHGLSILAEDELVKIAAVDTAQENVEKCKTACEQAKTNAKEARKNTAKIETHKSIWQEDAKKEAERLEDLEMEEFKPVLVQGEGAEDETVR